MPLRTLEHVAKWTETCGDATAVTQVTPLCAGTPTVTWAALYHAVMATAVRLRDVIEPGDVVIVCSPNRPEFIPAFLGVLAADAIVFPIHPGLTPAEQRDAVTRSGARAFIGEARHLDGMAALGLRTFDMLSVMRDGAPVGATAQLPLQLDRAGLYLQSSGTTGPPKIVYRTGRSLDVVAENVARSVQLTPGDGILAAIPICHSYGVENALLGPMRAGATVHLCNGFDPQTVLDAIEHGSATVWPATPFMLQMICDRAGRVTQRPRAVYSAGAILPPSVARACADRVGWRVGQLYGATEVGSVTFNDPDDHDFDPASVGRPMASVTVRICDRSSNNPGDVLPPGVEGEVAIAAASMLSRYVDDDSPAVIDGYVRTGDLGYVDTAGRLFITGRMKLQIDIGGTKVNPLEVEQVLIGHPAVRDCVVLAMPVAETLNRLRAVVEREPGVDDCTADALRQYARTQLAQYKIPRVIEFCDALPRTATGKVLRSAIGEAATCS